MKPINVLKVLALAVTFAVSGCTTTEYIHVSPECTPPPQPVLPKIDQGELWDALGDERYRELERYINGVWAYSDEQGAMLKTLCESE
ncbi:hypothetical protein AAG587_08345 [Vreelandella neptunia]|uniref:hypothetical protein n=1 Tax=Vreelandella neptunia TaxID=115551 RepID=UPI003159CDF2